MPVVFAIIGFFALFIPTRCVGCTIGLGTGTEFEHGEYAEYFYYDGSVHEFESDGGKEVGLIPGGTIFCEVNAKKENVVCYKLQGKTPVRTYIKSKPLKKSLSLLFYPYLVLLYSKTIEKEH